jgi:hypothetical protein
VGTRAAQAISKVVMAAVRAPQPRIALGSVAATVVRLPQTEACLAAGGTIEEAQQVLQGEIRPIDDVRSTAAYRHARGRQPPAAVVAGDGLKKPENGCIPPSPHLRWRVCAGTA